MRLTALWLVGTFTALLFIVGTEPTPLGWRLIQLTSPKDRGAMYSKSVIRVAVVTAGILLVPLVAMQFADQVNWTVADFLVMGVLLFSAGLALELSLRKLSKPAHRVIAGLAIVVLFLLIWAELAVGIFGTPWAGS